MMARKIFVLIICVIGLGLTSACSKSLLPPEVQTEVSMGLEHPNNAGAHYNLGIAYRKSGQYQDAIASYKKALRIKPDYAEAHNNLGIAYGSSGQYQEAIASYKKALRIQPDAAEAHNNLGLAYDELGQYQDAIASYKKALRIKPDLAEAHNNLGIAYGSSGQYQEAIASYKKALRIKPNNADAHHNLGNAYSKSGQYEEAIASYKEAIRIKPDDADAHNNLGIAYGKSGQYQEAIASFKEAIRIKPDYAEAHNNLGVAYDELGQYQDAIASYKKAIRIKPDDADAHNNLGYAYEKMGRNEEAVAMYKEALRINPNLTIARNHLNELEQKIAQAKPAPPVRQPPPQPPAKQTPQSGTGSGFFVSKMGHVITNAHVVQNCKKVTIGDNANKQVPAELINTDRSNDLALLKLSTLEMASAESKSLIQKLGIVVVPLASKGLLRSEDVRLGEKVLVAGYPFGDTFSNTIKVTTGVVSATRGAGDDSGQFQLDAAVQPGNSGGPIYDSSGNIVGVVTSQLNKRTFGSLVENVNFGVKASTVRQFLVSSGLSSKKSERTEEKSTEQLAEIAQNQALMVMCLQ